MTQRSRFTQPGGRSAATPARPASQQTAAPPPGYVERRCETCGSPHAPFGFNASLIRGLPGRNFCFEHRADGDRRPA